MNRDRAKEYGKVVFLERVHFVEHDYFNVMRYLTFLILFGVCFTLRGFGQEERHRMVIRTSAGQSFFDQLDKTAPFNQGSMLRMSYSSNIEIRMPFEIGYQYQIAQNHWLGLSFHQRPNYLCYLPEALAGPFWVGPVVLAAAGPDRGLAFTYESDWNVWKNLKGYSRLGLGVYRQTTSAQASDYSWYVNMPTEFYTYAAEATGQGLRPVVPMAQCAAGLRWKGFSLGYEVQGSLTPILNAAKFNGSTFQSPIRHYFMGLQAGYIYSFGR